jgi:hypothetical protein
MTEEVAQPKAESYREGHVIKYNGRPRYDDDRAEVLTIKLTLFKGKEGATAYEAAKEGSLLFGDRLYLQRVERGHLRVCASTPDDEGYLTAMRELRKAVATHFLIPVNPGYRIIRLYASGYRESSFEEGVYRQVLAPAYETCNGFDWLVNCDIDGGVAPSPGTATSLPDDGWSSDLLLRLAGPALVMAVGLVWWWRS